MCAGNFSYVLLEMLYLFTILNMYVGGEIFINNVKCLKLITAKYKIINQSDFEVCEVGAFQRHA